MSSLHNDEDVHWSDESRDHKIRKRQMVRNWKVNSKRRFFTTEGYIDGEWKGGKEFWKGPGLLFY